MLQVALTTDEYCPAGQRMQLWLEMYVPAGQIEVQPVAPITEKVFEAQTLHSVTAP
jgi:hypothetical protein